MVAFDADRMAITRLIEHRSIILGGVFALVAGRVHFLSLIGWGSGSLFLLAGVIVLPTPDARPALARRRRGRVEEAANPRWARLGSNQRPPACKAGALPLSYAPGTR